MPDQGVARRTEALTAGPSFTLQLPPELTAGGSGLSVSTNVTLGDRVQVKQPTGTAFAGIANLGSGQTVFGANDKTGDVWSVGPVQVGNGTAVSGFLKTAGTLVLGTNTTIAGAIQQSQPLTLPTLATVTVQFQNGATGVTVANDATRTLAPGDYAAVSIGARAVLALSTGDYRFDTLATQSPSTLRLTATSGPIRVFIRNTLTWNSTATFVTGDATKLLVGYAGTAAITVNTAFTGTLLSPNAAVTLPTSSSHTGAFFAKSLSAQADVTLTTQPFQHPCRGVVIDGGNVCTADACNATTGAVTHQSVANGTTCSDGNSCTKVDTCQTGVCVGSSPIACSAVDQCHSVGVCAPATGVCSNPTKADGSSCSDSSACTQGDKCQAGACVGASTVTCAAPDQCHSAGACNPATGVCSNPAKSDGSSCSDGNACTQSDTCRAGACTAGSSVTCAALDQCHTAGTCSPSSGCSNPVRANGSACSDGNACTQTDSCQAGTCMGTNLVACSAQDQCHLAGTCIPATGVCSNPIKNDGSACSDGNGCTQSDACQSGACVGGSPVVCAALDSCHSVGTCNATTGACSSPPKANGTVCSDGNACTQSDACQAGTCVGSSSVVCTAQDQCHVAGTCNTSTGSCSNPNKVDGSACSDNSVCTAGDLCTAGVCRPGTALATDDGNPCTADACDAATGVKHTPVAAGTSCSDGNACNGSEVCSATGTCMNGVAPVVDDGNPCTVDSCDALTGVHHDPLASGASPAVSPPGLDDHNPCTSDICDPIAGFLHQPAASGTSCSDGNPCNGDEHCDGSAVCLSGNPVGVDDANPCTADQCDAVSGVTHLPVAGGTQCSNGNLCDGAETCDGSGACKPGVAPIIDDGDPCTADSCDPLVGVKNVRTLSASCALPAFWQTLVASQPSPRDAAAGVFTTAGELFVFGGENAGATLADTWLWSAAQNRWRRGASGPSARAGAGVAFDSQRERVIVFGGVVGSDAGSPYLGDVWEYDTASDTWLARPTIGTAPSQRALAAFAYDSQMQQGLLFGGVGTTQLSDTWEWTAATGAWTQLSAQGPSARFGSAFAYDPVHGVFLLFGGSPQGVSGGALDDTWTFSASTGQWALVNSSIKPPARAGASMTYDASASRLVMVGGTSVDALNLNDAWDFDPAAGSWTQIASNAPVGTGAVIGFDPTPGQVLVASGLGYSDSGRFSSDFNAVWSFSRANQAWLARTANSAPARLDLGAAFDALTGHIVTRATVDPADISARPMMWDYDGVSRQWSATDASAAETDFGNGALQQAANVVNALVYDSDRNLTLQVTTLVTSGIDFGVVRIREWDGQRWKAGCNVQTPMDVGMQNASAIYDPPRKRILLFGNGKIVSIDPISCAASVLRPTGPGWVASVALGWDADRDVFVTFGGSRLGDPQSDTWEYDPIVNAWTAGGAGPSARTDGAIAYDSQRKKLVLYGGAFLTAPALRDTWEYSVATHSWSQLSLGGGPDKARAWIVYDGTRKQSMLVGTDGSIWSWDGVTWSQEVGSVAPSARSGMSGGWAPSLGAGLFFGGTSGDGRRAFLSDLWMWNGGWRQVSVPSSDPSPLLWGARWPSDQSLVTAAGPPARTGHVLATGYTGSSQIALLFGGEGDSGLLGDTWALGASSLEWSLQPQTTNIPSARTGHSMSLMPGQGYVMFGGLTHPSGGQDTLVNDTWFWTYGWGQMNLTGAVPSPRFGQAMATDEQRNQIVLFGGRGNSGVLGDTWLLDLNTLQSTGWQKLNPANAPLPRFGHAMSFDSARGRIVLTGGEGALPSQAFGDTWEWDPANTTWVKRASSSMDARAGQTAFFDKNLGQTIVFGGFVHDPSGQAALTHGDTLAFTGANVSDPPSLHSNGDRCTAPSSCASGLCVDGVCCNTGCTGQCAACDVPGSEGTCSPSTGAPHGTRLSCGGTGGECGPVCNGSDMTACYPVPTGTVCGAASGCNGGFVVSGAGVCDGSGSCSQASTSCLPFKCGSPPFVTGDHDACFTVCHSDGYCFSSDYRCTRPDTGTCYLAAKIAPNGVSVTPAAPKVGTPMTITVQPLTTGAKYVYTYRIVNAAGAFLLVCQGTSSTQCIYTPVAADAGVATVTVFAHAPAAQNGDDTSQSTTVTIGAAQ